MIIPKTLLEKADEVGFKDRAQRILEEGWKYLGENFTNESEYLNFCLKEISGDQFKDFLYTIFFYYAHDLYRIPEKGRIMNIDGFMYQISLSMIEHLNNNEKIPRERIKGFIQYFSPEAIATLNKNITARPLDEDPIALEFWEILYDMRNGFIHEAHWFNLIDQDSGAFASISFAKHRNEDKTYTRYISDIRIKFQEYLKFFWQAYLKYFGKNSIIQA